MPERAWGGPGRGCSGARFSAPGLLLTLDLGVFSAILAGFAGLCRVAKGVAVCYPGPAKPSAPLGLQPWAEPTPV